MKKFILYPLLGLFSFLFMSVLTLVLVFFFSPTTIVNPTSIAWVLNKTSVLKSWSWKEAVMEHESRAWNHRIVRGHFTDLCFEYESKGPRASGCFSEISWNFDLLFDLKKRFHVRSLDPLKIHSPELVVDPGPPSPETKEETPPPPIRSYWKILWADMIPDLDIDLRKVKLKTLEFDIKVDKKPKSLDVRALSFHLWANPDELGINGPEVYKLPIKKPMPIPMELRKFRFHADMRKDRIPLKATGAIDPVGFELRSELKLPLVGLPDSVELKRELMLKASGELTIKDIKESLKKHGQKKYQELPAPLNEMNGDIISRITTKEGSGKNIVDVTALTDLRLESEKQALIMKLGTHVPFNVQTMKPGVISLSLNFERVKILLPRISKTSTPPQFKPDGRIRRAKPPEKKADPEGDGPLIHLKASKEEALHLVTDLLDEPIRLNLDLNIRGGNLDKGFVSVLPLKTKVFKRPVNIQSLVVSFDHPRDPIIEATIKFPLPEYKITLNVEGPVTGPRTAFRSEPPLPQNDIYAVLLFGRPMAELDPEDKTSAQKTNQMLSNGILSLSVLYFLAGSPVEYVGFDPETNKATAQIGLSSKTSFRVGGGGQGGNSTGIRQSLGKGWYLDTSVQSPSGSADRAENNYGVMLERIIAY